MNLIYHMIFKPNKQKTRANNDSIRQKRSHRSFKVKSGVKAGAIDISAFSLDSLSHSNNSLDDTLNSDLFYKK